MHCFVAVISSPSPSSTPSCNGASDSSGTWFIYWPINNYLFLAAVIISITVAVMMVVFILVSIVVATYKWRRYIKVHALQYHHVVENVVLLLTLEY